MTVAQGLPRSQARARTARHGGQRLRAPFPLRCGALLIDYIALISLAVLGTLVARMLGGGARSAGNSAETAGIMLAVLWLDEPRSDSGFHWFDAWQVGHWVAHRKKRRRACWNRSRIVTSFHWLSLSFALLGLGFLIAAFSVHGRGLHDMIAGTIVVREGSSS